MPRAVNGMKICPRETCPHQGNPQPTTNFYRSNCSVDGYQSICITCELAYRVAHKDHDNKQKQKNYREHREERKVSGKKWNENNPDKLQSYRGRRRARRQNGLVGALFTRRDLISIYGSICYLCDHEIDLDVPKYHPWAFTEEHVVPLSRGGSHSIGNCRPAHRYCNVSVKGQKLLSELPPLPWDPPPTYEEEEAS